MASAWSSTVAGSLSVRMRARQTTQRRGRRRSLMAVWIVRTKHRRQVTRWAHGKVCIVATADRHTTHYTRDAPSHDTRSVFALQYCTISIHQSKQIYTAPWCRKGVRSAWWSRLVEFWLLFNFEILYFSTDGCINKSLTYLLTYLLKQRQGQSLTQCT